MKRFTEPETIEVDKIKGSRFIVTTSPIESEQSVQTILTELRKQHPNANHHCWAYRLGDIDRSSDDGEPSGSAGEPILQRMKRHQLMDSLIVVTRYFGGTKLGVGGLVRAYGGSAGEAIETVKVQQLVNLALFEVEMSYSDQSLIKSIVQLMKGKIVVERYTDTVYVKVQIEPHDTERFVVQCRDRTAGRVVPSALGNCWIVQE